MDVSIQTLSLVREETDKNIAIFCERHGEDFNYVKEYMQDKADKHNVLSPADYILRVYEMSVDYLID